MPNLDLDPITRKEQFLSRAAGGTGLDLEPVTREEHFLKAIADSGGGGGAVTPESIVTATGRMTAAQAAQTRGSLGAAQAETVIPIVVSNPHIFPEINTIYECGTLTRLTITDPPAQGTYSIVFTSGSTPTEVFIPPKPAMMWQTADNNPPQGFPAANTRYEINVENTYVVLGEWPVPEVSA